MPTICTTCPLGCVETAAPIAAGHWPYSRTVGGSVWRGAPVRTGTRFMIQVIVFMI